MTPDLPVGVHRLHDDVSLDFQLNRLATLGGGRLDEVREAASRIRDLDDWKREFLALAERASSEGRAQQVAAYLRAAEFMMAPGDPDKAAAYERQINDLVADDEDLVAFIGELESHYDGGDLDPPDPSAPVEEVEQFLRDQD